MDRRGLYFVEQDGESQRTKRVKLSYEVCIYMEMFNFLGYPVKLPAEKI